MGINGALDVLAKLRGRLCIGQWSCPISFERNEICAAIDHKTWHLMLSLCGRPFIKVDYAA